MGASVVLHDTGNPTLGLPLTGVLALAYFVLVNNGGVYGTTEN
jgi:hypothetical protein